MIVTENIVINDKSFIRTFSDLGYMVEREGVRYSEAIDLTELNRKYIETDELTEVEELSDIEQKAKAYDILMGVIE